MPTVNQSNPVVPASGGPLITLVDPETRLYKRRGETPSGSSLLPNTKAEEERLIRREPGEGSDGTRDSGVVTDAQRRADESWARLHGPRTGSVWRSAVAEHRRTQTDRGAQAIDVRYRICR
jgi:hypothetical protein